MISDRRRTFTRRLFTVIVVFTLLCGVVMTRPVRAATWVVTKTADTNDGVCDSDCSLREAIAVAAANDSITFDASLSGATIQLSSPQLSIMRNVTIDGSSLASPVTISASGPYGTTFRVFYMESVTVTMNKLRIVNGWKFSGGGGGICAMYCNLSVANCTFADNFTDSSGGGIYSISGNLTVDNSTFSGNRARDYQGGGIYSTGNLGNNVTVTNSTFSGNRAVYGGGGIYNYGCTLTVNSCTLSSNEAYDGAGIYNDETGIFNRSNTIIANSIYGEDCYNYTTWIGSNNNMLVEDGSCTAAWSGDPNVGSLADNGGPTQTMALLPGSFAIDLVGGGPAADQRGVPRPQGGGYDVGAFEVLVPQTGPTFVVNATGDPGDGVCHPYAPGIGDCTLREAVNAASTGNTIIFDDRISGATIFLGWQVVLDKNLTIDGSSLAAPIDIDAQSVARVFLVNSGVDATLKGLVMRNGRTVDENGGAIHNSGTLTVTNCTVATSNAHSTGSTVFTGGGIYNGATLLITNSTISGNTVTSSGFLDIRGGGIYNDGVLTVIRGNFSGNDGSWYGGGIYTTNSLLVTDSIFTANAASVGGGIFNASTLVVSNSTFSGNNGTIAGGGISTSYGSATVTNSTFTGNGTGLVGGIYNYQGTLTINNCTLSGNSAMDSTTGGSIYNAEGTLNFSNTIVADTPGGYYDCYNSNGTIGTNIANLVENNAMGVNACGTADFNSDPVLIALADNGGNTWTMALGSGSPAIDNGDDDTCDTAPVSGRDQRGMIRPQGSSCDLGAFEFGGDISQKDITSFSFASPAVTGLIEGTEILVIVPNGTDRTALVPTITHTGASISPESDVAQNFTNPVVYTVTAVNRTTKAYTVTVSYCSATGSVTNANDNGAGSLRRTIYTMCSGGTITFGSDFTITLASTLTIDKSLTIDATGRSVTISGNNAVRVFSISTGVTVTLNNLTIANGNAGGGGNGGGILNPSGAILTVTNSTFTGNYSYLGGGIYSEGNLTVANCTFSGNTTTDGGGICSNAPGILNVANSTFSGNRAFWEGGSIFNTGTFTYSNCILANSTIDSGGAECWTNVVPSSTNNLTDDGSCLATIIADPVLGPLANNGGYTQTMVLLQGSPAIDAGNDAACGASPVNGRDQRGVNRPQRSHCDMGAFEDYAKEITAFDFTTPPATGVINVTNISLTVPYGTNLTALVPTISHTGSSINPASGVAQNFTNPVNYTVSAPDGTTKVYTVTVTVACGSAIVVSNANDSGAGSLRQAIANLCAGGTITFGSDYSITLASELTIDKNMTINGSGHTVWVSGNNAVRVFSVNAGVSVNMLNLVVTNGNAGGGNGSGIYVNTGSNLSYTDGTLSGNGYSFNEGGGNGGAIFVNTGGSATVTNSTFYLNKGYLGGGIYNDGSLTVTNCTFSDNLSTDGGGILNQSNGTMALTNVTFSHNTGYWAGGCIFNNTGSSLHYTNCILANSTIGAGGLELFNFGTILTNTNNLVEDGSGWTGGVGFLSGDPNLDSLANNGGPAWTRALLAGSAAIDSGNDATCPGTDQRGVIRPRGGHCDRGSYEYVDTTVPTVTSFSATSPSSSNSIPITAFTATDDVAVTDYLITLSATPPTAGTPGWSGAAPTTYTVSGSGTYTLYPWAMDATENVSTLYGSPATVVVNSSTYADPAGVCGGQAPCYTTIQAAIDAAGIGANATVYPGSYNESVVLARNITVVLLDGDVSLSGSLTISDGSFIATRNTLAIGGSFTHNGGIFNPDRGTVKFTGGSSQAITGLSSTAFDNLVIDAGGTYNLGSALYVTGNVTLTSGTLDVTTTNYGITVDGDIIGVGGVLTARQGTVNLRGLRPQTLSTASPFNHLILGDGLVGHWKLDEGSGTTTADSSGNGHTGSLVSGPVWSTITSPAGFANPAAILFDGSAGWVSAGSASSLVMQYAMTLSCWIRPTASPEWAIIVNKEGEYELARYADGTIQWAIARPDNTWAWVNTGFVAPLDQWSHIALVYDNGLVTTYANGLQVHSAVNASGAIGDAAPSLNEFRIGNRDLGIANLPFAGQIDDVRLYNRTMAGADIAKVMNLDLIAYWKFDEGSGSTATDSSGNGRTGTLIGPPAWSTTVPATIFVNSASLSFDGIDDYVSALDSADSTSYTIAAWVRPADTADRNIIVRTNANGPLLGASHEIQISGGVFVHYLFDAGMKSVIGTTPIVAGTWYHVAAVATTNGSMKLFVNGLSEGTPASIGTPWIGGDRWYIGSNAPGLDWFSGLMDDVRIYQRVLSSGEIQLLAAGGQPSPARTAVTLGAPLDVDGNISLQSGSLDVGPGNHGISLAGNWSRSLGTFAPGSGTVSFNGSGTQTITGDTGFGGITITGGVTVVTTAEVSLSGPLLNNGWTDETRTIGGTGSCTFGLASISVDVTTQGSLSSLQVLRRDQNHASASPSYQTGKFWTINPGGASGYSVNLTLPHNGLADPLAARWTGAAWEVARTSFTDTTVTRNGITAFSDWTVGQTPPPPMADGKLSGSMATFSKHEGSSTTIDVTYDITTCSDSKAIILYGTMGSFTTYVDCTQSNAGNSGMATIDATGLDNVWFNIIWTEGTIAGHPGYLNNGTTDMERVLNATNRCGILADDHSHANCP